MMQYEMECKTCRVHFETSDKRQIVCSRACGHKGRRKQRISVLCGVCGRSVDRYEADAQKRTSFACSKKCQVRLAARSGAVMKKAAVGSAKRIKAEWYDARSRDRRANNAWWKLCCSALRAIPEQDEWSIRCNAAVVGLQKRAIAKPVLRRKEECSSWRCSIQHQIGALRQRKKQSSLMPWDRKVLNAVSSLAKRRRKRFEKQVQHS